MNAGNMYLSSKAPNVIAVETQPALATVQMQTAFCCSLDTACNSCDIHDTQCGATKVRLT